MRLIEKVWFKSHPAKWLVVPLLLPFTVLFFLLSYLRRLCYAFNLFKSYQVAKPVVVVGNIGVGGNGKTPIIVLLVEVCRELGLTPGVISRGYGSKAPHYPYLLNENSNSVEAGDEPVLIYQRCQVPVVIGSDRVENSALLLEQGCDIILADDGLQHYRLQRNIELIIVDGKRLFGNGLLLPAGPLREGKWRLKTADFVIVNGAESKTKLIENELTMQLKAKFVCHLLTGERSLINDFIEKNPLINAIAGIGSPERFFSTLQEAKFELNSCQGFVDHHQFTRNDFDCYNEDLPLLMTEKDAVKCQSFAKDNWWYLPVDAVISEYQLAQLKSKIKKISI